MKYYGVTVRMKYLSIRTMAAKHFNIQEHMPSSLFLTLNIKDLYTFESNFLRLIWVQLTA